MRIWKSHPLFSLINGYLVDSTQPSNISYLPNIALIVKLFVFLTASMLFYLSINQLVQSYVNVSSFLLYMAPNVIMYFFFLYLYKYTSLQDFYNCIIKIINTISYYSLEIFKFLIICLSILLFIVYTGSFLVIYSFIVLSISCLFLVAFHFYFEDFKVKYPFLTKIIYTILLVSILVSLFIIVLYYLNLIYTLCKKYITYMQNYGKGNSNSSSRPNQPTNSGGNNGNNENSNINYESPEERRKRKKREWYAKNKDKMKEWRKQYEEKNKERRKQYEEKNKERIKEKARENYQKHKLAKKFLDWFKE